MNRPFAPAATGDAKPESGGCAPVARPMRGQREVFCGLTGIIWLHRKIQDAFFLVVGSRTCAHLIQSAAGVMIFAEPRFATAIIDERDLSGIADANDELDRVVERLLSRRPDIKLLFLVGSCPSEVIKLDLSRAALRLSQKFAPAARVLAYSGSGIETTFTQGEDACLAAIAEYLPEEDPEAGDLAPRRRRSGGRGRGPDVADVRAARHRQGQLPAPAQGERHALRRPQYPLPAGPALPRGDGAGAGKPGCQAPRSPVPAGRRGHDGMAQISCERVRRQRTSFRRGDRPVSRARRPLERYRAQLEGKTVFFFPDSQLEVPLARFLARELGMRAIEIGTPYLHRQHLARKSR
jgi:light-independent protochlorophyllide reductase subunit N